MSGIVHHLMVGPDWWGCTCGDGGAGALSPALAHGRYLGVDLQVVSWPWDTVREAGESFTERRRWLQRQGAL